MFKRSVFHRNFCVSTYPFRLDMPHASHVRAYRTQKLGRIQLASSSMHGTYKRSDVRKWSTMKYGGNKPYSSIALVSAAFGMCGMTYIACAIWDDSEEAKRNRSRRFNLFSSLESRIFAKQSSIMQSPKDEDLVSSIKRRILSMNDGQKVIYSIIGVNSLVFFAWQIRPFSSFMKRYFMNSPTHHPITLFTSTYSHVSFMHILFNMLALSSFGIPMVNQVLGGPQFLLLYTSAGVLSSLGSCLWKRHAINRISSIIPSFKTSTSSAPSLGASGCLYGVIGVVAHFPKMKIGLLFLPGITVGADVAFKGLLTFDVLGLFNIISLGFDHAAHIVGGLVGYFYYAHGRFIWAERKNVLQYLGWKSIE